MSIKELMLKYNDYVIQTRREFHKIPEASFKEYKTCEKIREELSKMGIESEIIADTGVIATIKGKKDGKTVGLRADIDGLNVTEQTGLEYTSINEGFMHACGHDCHIAMLLGAAQILKDMKEELNGDIRLIFQPGEEMGIGSLKIIEAGALKGLDTIFGMHVWCDLPAGKISVESGPRMASADYIYIDIYGKSSHGALPHQGVDAVVVGSAIVNNLQTIASRELPPLEPIIVTIGTFNAGERFNIVAGEAHLTGTTRTFNNEIREQLPEILDRILQNTAAAFKAKVTLRVDRGPAVVINDKDCFLIAEDAVKNILGEEALALMEKTGGGDDFADLQNIVPGVYGFVGISNPEVGAIYSQHSCYYRVDETALIGGAGVAAQYALDYLNKHI